MSVIEDSGLPDFGLRHFVNRRWPIHLMSLLLLLLSPAVVAQPHAEDPLPAPHFSVDRDSPLSVNGFVTAADVLEKPGPTVKYPGTNLGLYDGDDDLDGISYNRAETVGFTQDFLLLFGVHRLSVGAVPPDSGLVGSNRPFNVSDQALRHQVPGDLYMTLDAFRRQDRHAPRGGDRSQNVTPCVNLPQRLDRGRANNNTLCVNQGDTGGVDKDLSPEAAPVQQGGAKGRSFLCLRDTGSGSSGGADNSDATAYPPGSGRGGSDPGLFFTVTADSPSLQGSLPGESGADVFLAHDPSIADEPVLYADAVFDLGLIGPPGGDDIDALIVFDEDGDGTLDPGVDQILFSLAPGSPSLNVWKLSAADILASFGEGGFYVFLPAVALGLEGMADSVDCLELTVTSDPVADVYDHAIFLVWPGDYDKNGTLTSADCDAFEGCYSGDGVSYDTNGVATLDVEVGPGPGFTPDQITVETGDTIHWIWIDGPHSVVSGEDGTFDGVFRSGPPEYPPTTFDVTFDEPLLNLYPRGGSIYHYFSDAPGDLVAGMVGLVTVEPHECATFDLDFDGDVDCEDWAEFKAVYRDANGGAICVPLTIPDFVAALLGNPVHPAHVCLADMNDDEKVDGLDIQGYVNAALFP
ncbi:MAG: hypothetical protein JXQ75_23075 [Phycisphaerae bacterium]|nr:hypothetical protein [Phycisphaerae bacterium]